MTESQKETLIGWHARYIRAQVAHSHSATAYERISTIAGVSLILLTISTSVCTFADFSNTLKWIPIVLGILATILATFQTFYRFSEKAGMYRNIASRFGALRKDIEFIIEFRATENEEQLKRVIAELRSREDELILESPYALPSSWKKAKKRVPTKKHKYSLASMTPDN